MDWVGDRLVSERHYWEVRGDGVAESSMIGR